MDINLEGEKEGVLFFVIVLCDHVRRGLSVHEGELFEKIKGWHLWREKRRISIVSFWMQM